MLEANVLKCRKSLSGMDPSLVDSIRRFKTNLKPGDSTDGVPPSLSHKYTTDQLLKFTRKEIAKQVVPSHPINQ